MGRQLQGAARKGCETSACCHVCSRPLLLGVRPALRIPRRFTALISTTTDQITSAPCQSGSSTHTGCQCTPQHMLHARINAHLTS